MPNASSSTAAAVLLRTYNIFSRTDSQYTSPVGGPRVATSTATFGSHLSYYVALACVLLVVYVLRGRRKSQLNLPFYKAAKTKWIFDAERLVRDSYNKVCSKPWTMCKHGH